MSDPGPGPSPSPNAVSVFPGSIYGLILSNDVGAPTTTIDVAAGSCADSTAISIIMLGAFTKTLSGTWVVGSGNAGLDTGAVAANTWYHVYAISKVGGVNADILLSKSATVAGLVLPNGYTLARRVGSILTDVSSHIIGFTQSGNDFRWLVQVANVTAAPVVNTALLATLSTPLGVKVIANLMIFLDVNNSSAILITSPDDTDTAPGTSVAGPFTLLVSSALPFANTSLNVRTNTSSQARYRTSATNNTSVGIYTIGWTDDRGRNQ